MVTELALFDLDESECWTPMYKTGPGLLCRDCGRTKFTWTRSCAGAGGEGIFDVCDDCAALDGRGQRSDGSVLCSRWGIVSTDDEAARLVELQRQRRANTLANARADESFLWSERATPAKALQQHLPLN